MTLEEYTKLRQSGLTKEQILGGATQKAVAPAPKPKTGPLKAISNDIGRLNKGLVGFAGALAPVFPQIGAQLAVPGIMKAQEKALNDKLEVDQRLLEIIKRPTTPPERKKFLASLMNDASLYDFTSQVPEIAPSAKQVAGAGLQTAALFAPVGTAARGITAGLKGAGIKTGSQTIGNIVSGAGAGYTFDAGNNLMQNKPALGAPGLGTALGAGIPVAGAALQGLKSTLPGLLGRTTELGRGAFERLAENPNAVKSAMKEGATIESALKNAQGTVRNFRKELSLGWKQNVSKIIEENTGVRASVPSAMRAKLQTAADEFGVSLPQNLNDLSARESIKLLTDFNSLQGLRVAVSPKGAIVREVRPQLKKVFTDAFGGADSTFGRMYSQYSIKSDILQAADDIVRAYATKKPKTQQTALRNLERIFLDNKSEYLKALIDLEKATGQDILSQVAGSQFRKTLPITGRGVNPLGAFGNAVEFLIDLALFPLTSPRMAKILARTAGRGAPGITFPGDKLLRESPTAKRVYDDISMSMRMPGLGMSIRDVSGGKSSVKLNQAIETLKRLQKSRENLIQKAQAAGKSTNTPTIKNLDKSIKMMEKEIDRNL